MAPCTSVTVGYVDGKNSISDNSFQNSITAYPNPCVNSTTIEYQLAEEETVSVVVYDKSGRLVATLVENEFQTKGEYQHSFNMEALPEGVYFYQLLSETQQKSGKIIKTASF